MAHGRIAPLLLPAVLALSCTAGNTPGGCGEGSGMLPPPGRSTRPLRILGRKGGWSVFRCDIEGDIALRLDDAASLPGNVVFLGGEFEGGGGRLGSALLVSRDGGRTWREAALPRLSGAIQNLRTLGTSYVWGIATFTQEGNCDPERVVHSDDAGKTWSVTPLDPRLSGPTCVSRFEFDDPEHGLLSVSNMIYQTKTFATEDGGGTWRLLWSARRNVHVEVEEGADHPPLPRRPPSAPLYEQELDCHKVSGWVRPRETDESIVVEACDLEFPLRWRERARIPRRYRIMNGRLAPSAADSGRGNAGNGRAGPGLAQGGRAEVHR